MVRYKEYFQKMIKENKDVFDAFTKIHFDYSIDPKGMQKIFNLEGGKVQDIIRDYENRLCSNTERGMYNRYSGGLAEKFQDEIRGHFPLIDHVGLVADTAQTPAEVDTFKLKKITLPL